MRRTAAPLEVLLLALNVLGGDALCAQRFLSIDTTTLTISGCYEETIYAGTYQTKVWTIDGGDIVSAGTKAIVADLVSSPQVYYTSSGLRVPESFIFYSNLRYPDHSICLRGQVATPLWHGFASVPKHSD